MLAMSQGSTLFREEDLFCDQHPLGQTEDEVLHQQNYITNSIRKCDSTAELCALQVLESNDDEPVTRSATYQNVPTYSTCGFNTSSADFAEPEIIISHSALRSRNFGSNGRSYNFSEEDFDFGLLDLDSENVHSADMVPEHVKIGQIFTPCDNEKMNQLPGEPTASFHSFSSSRPLGRSSSDELLSSLEHMTLAEQSIQRSSSANDVAQAAFSHRSQVSVQNNSFVIQKSNASMMPQLLEQNSQIRRVTSNPVFPSHTLAPVPTGRLYKSGSSAALQGCGGGAIILQAPYLGPDAHGQANGISYPAFYKKSSSCDLDMLQSAQVSMHPVLCTTTVPVMQVQHGTRNQGIPMNVLAPEGDGYLYQVQFKRGIRSFLLSSTLASSDMKIGSYVKVEADRGEDLGKVVSKIPRPMFNSGQKPSSGHCDKERILRHATESELHMIKAKAIDEHRVLEVCRLKVKQRNLPMEVIDAEFQFDRHKLTFFFKAEGRIDFRELVRDLFALYKTRIWMQQVEVNLPISF